MNVFQRDSSRKVANLQSGSSVGAFVGIGPIAFRASTSTFASAQLAMRSPALRSGSTLMCAPSLPSLRSDTAQGTSLRSRYRLVGHVPFNGTTHSLNRGLTPVMSLDPKQIFQTLHDLRHRIQDIPAPSKAGQHQKEIALFLITVLENQSERLAESAENEKKVWESETRRLAESVENEKKVLESETRRLAESAQHEQELRQSEVTRLEAELKRLVKENLTLSSKNEFRGVVEYLLDKVLELHRSSSSQFKCKHKFTVQEEKSKKEVLEHLRDCAWLTEHIETGYNDDIWIQPRPAKQVQNSVGSETWSTICSMHHPPFDSAGNIQIPVGGPFTDNAALLFYSLARALNLDPTIVKHS